jgi:hypothetical protein
MPAVLQGGARRGASWALVGLKLLLICQHCGAGAGRSAKAIAFLPQVGVAGSLG